MVLVLFLFGLIFLLTLITIVSTLKITIDSLNISNEVSNTPIIKKVSASIGIYILNKFKIYEKKITEENIQQIKKSNNMDMIKNKFKIEIRNDKKKRNIESYKQIIKQLNLKLEKLDLNLLLGTEDVVLTSFLICIVSIIFSTFLARIIDKYDENKYKYTILPRYNNKNSIEISLEGILSIKLVNIINILFRLLFRSDEKYERASDRRSYDNCNEQYPRNDRCKYNYRGTN